MEMDGKCRQTCLKIVRARRTAGLLDTLVDVYRSGCLNSWNHLLQILGAARNGAERKNSTKTESNYTYCMTYISKS